ncbi:MAG: hypothetical protein KF894_00905 [Labilithrix sp.]|nr:hypothetical protein [Labilithrix sp.]
MRKDAPLAVEVPAPDRDKPGWVKVGVIAAVGFVLGIAWPRVMGIRLGPAAPGESTAAAASAASAAGRAPEAPPASVTAKGPAASASAPANAVNVAHAATAKSPPNISLQKGAVLSCKTKEGDTKKGRECGPVPGIDLLVQPRVRKIATCSGVEGQTGKLSLVVNADFATGRFWYDVGKSSTLPNIDAVAACLKTTFHGTSTTATTHEHPRYTVAYTAIFAPGTGAAPDELAAKKPGKDDADVDRSEASAKSAPDEKKAASGEKKPASDDDDDKADKKEEKSARAALASGEAAVAWEVALVRETPKTGSLVARLPRGAKVKVGTAKDGWFLIKYGEGYAHEGWVYRGAIGR